MTEYHEKQSAGVKKVCDAFGHQWAEQYYGYRCTACGTFIPFGCEPWLPDEDRSHGLPFVVRS